MVRRKKKRDKKFVIKLFKETAKSENKGVQNYETEFGDDKITIKVKDDKIINCIDIKGNKLKIGEKQKYCLFKVTYKFKEGDKISDKTNSVYLYCSDIESVENGDGDYCGIFTMKNNITGIEIIAADTSAVKDFSEMFSGCSSLQNIKGLEKWNVCNGNIFGEVL